MHHTRRVEIINSYHRLPERCYVPITPPTAPSPRLIAWNEALAAHLGLDALSTDSRQLADLFSGTTPLPGAEPIALAYAGHQFGSFVPQLGDGRAALLGEVISPVDQRRYDIQLKGSGRTPFSRRGDGKASLGPVLREYLVSEAMFALGIPTTRSLAAVATGESIVRQRLEPGAVLTRIASSHLRVGTFQYVAARHDRDALSHLIDYAIERHFPGAATASRPALALFSHTVEAQAVLVAHWMSVGFIHGVMNTDNCAISGETLDYGPCAFLDEFDIDKVFSSIDQYGRYAYGQQANMAQWNLARLADCLVMVEGELHDYQEILDDFQPRFEYHYYGLMSRKLGLEMVNGEAVVLINAWLQHLQEYHLDYSQSFIQLAGQLNGDATPRFGPFEQQWRAMIDRQPGGRECAARLMVSANPRFIPRNHQIERAIQAALVDDLTPFTELQQVLSAPYQPHAGLEYYADPPGEHERVAMTFCGT